MKHTAKLEGVYVRHYIDGEQVAVLDRAEWDSYCRSTWSLDPSVVALEPTMVADFPGDASSKTPAKLPTLEDANEQVAQTITAAQFEGTLRETSAPTEVARALSMPKAKAKAKSKPSVKARRK